MVLGQKLAIDLAALVKHLVYRSGLSVGRADAVAERHLHMVIIAQPCALYKPALKLAAGSAWACSIVAAACISKAKDLRALTPLLYSHVNLYRVFRLNMTARLPLAEVEA